MMRMVKMGEKGETGGGERRKKGLERGNKKPN